MSFPSCRLCEIVHETPWDQGKLLLSFPSESLVAGFKSSLDAYGLIGSVSGPTIAVPLGPGAAEIAFQLLRESDFLEEVRYAHEVDAAKSQWAPVTQAIEGIESNWIRQLLRESRLTTYFQPLVRCATPSEIMGHESLMRGFGKDGELIFPLQLLDAARATGTLFHLDRLARTTAIQSAAEARLLGRIFVNFNPNSIYNPEHCLRTTLQAVRKADLAPDRIVFEVVESEVVSDFPRLRRIADFYRREGFGVAVDDLDANREDFNRVTELQPEFVKLDMKLTRGIDSDLQRQQEVTEILDQCRRLGMQTVVEGIETPEEHAFVASAGADFAQGYLFGRPAPYI